jgi:hypothetical protein
VIPGLPVFCRHLAKYRSLMPSLAGLFELADHVAAGKGFGNEIDISLDHAKQAAAFCEYLEEHIHRVYACVISPETRSARELARQIIEEARDQHPGHVRSWSTSPNEWDARVQLGEGLGHLVRLVSPRSETESQATTTEANGFIEDWVDRELELED